MPVCRCRRASRRSTNPANRAAWSVRLRDWSALLLALVLGTLIGVSFAYFSTQKTELEGFSAQILRLDQALGQYGPETKPLRDKIKAGIVKKPTRHSGAAATPIPAVVGRGAVGQRSGDQRLSGDSETHDRRAEGGTGDCKPVCRHGRAIAASHVAAGGERSGVLGSGGGAGVLDGGVVFRIGLYAAPNALVIAAIAFGAASIAFAIFLILELGEPYTGLFRVRPPRWSRRSSTSTNSRTANAPARRMRSAKLSRARPGRRSRGRRSSWRRSARRGCGPFR